MSSDPFEVGACACGGPLERAIATISGYWAGCLTCFEDLKETLDAGGVEYEEGTVQPKASA